MKQTPDESGLALALTVAFSWIVVYLIIQRVRHQTCKPDPWDAQIQEELQKENAVSLCHHCLAEQKPSAWFCEKCGSSTGPYNNYLPYVYVFPLGEFLRTGTTMRLKKNALMVCGYFLAPIAYYGVFTPVYWYRFLRNLITQPERAVNTEDQSEISSNQSDQT